MTWVAAPNAAWIGDASIIGMGDEASAETSLKTELLPPQHKPPRVTADLGNDAAITSGMQKR